MVAMVGLGGWERQVKGETICESVTCYLDLGDGHMNGYACQNSSSCTLRFGILLDIPQYKNNSLL